MSSSWHRRAVLRQHPKVPKKNQRRSKKKSKKAARFLKRNNIRTKPPWRWIHSPLVLVFFLNPGTLNNQFSIHGLMAWFRVIQSSNWYQDRLYHLVTPVPEIRCPRPLSGFISSGMGAEKSDKSYLVPDGHPFLDGCSNCMIEPNLYNLFVRTGNQTSIWNLLLALEFQVFFKNPGDFSGVLSTWVIGGHPGWPVDVGGWPVAASGSPLLFDSFFS